MLQYNQNNTNITGEIPTTKMNKSFEDGFI